MKKNEKFYLMSAGIIAPALVGMATYKIMKKECVFDTTSVIIIIGLAVAGGYITGRILKGK